MVEMITEMVRRKDGLYDLTIRTKDGKTLLDVKSIRHKRALGLIDETEKKVDEG